MPQSSLSRAEVERIAALANLELTEREIETFGRQLADILAYAEQVQQLDTTGVPPTSHVLAGQPLDRADEPRPSLDRERALASAPEAALDAGLFQVPRVIG
jgi:aspartyl-tRNA(Asn)/glutamyl-tRNA(Gln) amidotransferase subunit C